MENQAKGMNEQATENTTNAGASATAGPQGVGLGDSRGRALSPELREKYLQNPYVKAINQVGDITYWPTFYEEMYRYIHYGDMTYAAAYEKLGFSVEELGENRAFSAGKRAVKTYEEGQFRPGKFNGTIPLDEMNFDGKSEAEEMAMLKARIIYLEAYVQEQKKNVLYTPTEKIEIEADEVILDKNQMAYNIFQREEVKPEEDRLPIDEILNIVGNNEKNYEAWMQQQRARMEGEESLSEAQLAWKNDQELMIGIVHSLGYVPGVRVFRNMFMNKHNRNISIKRARKLMRSLNLVAYVRKRDAYKHQATHNHPFAVPCGNVLNRQFYLGPRKVVCTDVTYFYFGENRTPHYLCCFKDAYTTEILGAAAGSKMTTDLIKEAYDKMNAAHGHELEKAKVILHSDQGSQYCSVDYKDLLTGKYIQSMSRRGNSQDNDPVESFFGLLKSMTLEAVALAKTRDQVNTMLENAIEMYNNVRAQDRLACLTPSQFYDYATTGVYPLESYFGVDASEIRTITELDKDRKRFAFIEAEKRREAYAKKKEEEAKKEAEKEDDDDADVDASADAGAGAGAGATDGKVDPLKRIRIDRRCLRKHSKKNDAKLENAQKLKEKYAQIEQHINEAETFIKNASPEVLKKLETAENWASFSELGYIFEMNEMF